MAQEVLTANAADARVAVGNVTFATARAATTGTLQGASTNPTGIGSSIDAGTYNLRRFFMYFASSSSGTVTSATFSFEVQAFITDADTIHLVESSASTTVQAADYNNVNFTSFGSVAVSGTGVKNITVNATGQTYIENNMGGNIKLALLGNGDQANSAPTNAFSISAYTGDEASNQKPTLTINFTTPGGNPMFFQGGGVAVG